MAVLPKPDRPFGVYVHFPFCAHKCPYCDFNTQAARELPHDAYLRAVLSELKTRAVRFEGRRLVSIYFGGGTPGLWRPDCIGTVIDAVRSTWKAYADPRDVALNPIEITVEVNPRAAPVSLLTALRKAGVNRLSVGAQTFDETYLKRLGRDHSVAQSLATLKAAQTVGFQRISFDLLFGGPHHTLEAFEHDLSVAAGLKMADHVSAYSLIVEPGTPFARLKSKSKLHETDDDQVADMLELCNTRLRDSGFTYYEIANYTQPGRWARHNSLYWTGAEYMGLGVGAHELALLPDGRPVRRAGALMLADYLNDPAGSAADEEHLDAKTHLAERVFLGLRTHFGISLGELTLQFGQQAVAAMVPKLARLEEKGWIVQASQRNAELPGYLQSDEGGFYRPTLQGMRFANRVALEVL